MSIKLELEFAKHHRKQLLDLHVEMKTAIVSTIGGGTAKYSNHCSVYRLIY
jgi:hypothetical protein